MCLLKTGAEETLLPGSVRIMTASGDPLASLLYMTIIPLLRHTRPPPPSIPQQLLKEWEQHLLARTQLEKLSAEGKMLTKTQKQCKDYMRPFFKMCKKKVDGTTPEVCDAPPPPTHTHRHTHVDTHTPA